jgi:prepilin-type N-terminal cleavage/methylation domain-containing protein
MKIFKAFTLIELLVVISIIGILAALLLANFAGIRDRADDARLKNDLKQFQTAMRTRYNDDQAYPAGTDAACNTAALLVVGTTTYMTPTAVPVGRRYSRGTTGDTFTACVPLSNTADKDIAASQLKCPPGTLTGITPTNGFCVCSN